MRQHSPVVLWIVLLGSRTPDADAAPLRVGNLLVAVGTEGKIYEFTRDGELVQAISVPGGDRSMDPVGDIVLDPLCRIAVYNGAGNPLLSFFDPLENAWTHTSMEGWHTLRRRQAIARYESWLFLTIHPADGQPGGILRHDIETGAFERFFADWAILDGAVGLDGYLYVLRNFKTLVVVDPRSMEIVRTVEQSSVEAYGVAVDAQGNIFLTGTTPTEGDRICRFDPLTLEAHCIFTSEAYRDIDISPDGSLLLGGTRGHVCLADGSLECSRIFQLEGFNEQVQVQVAFVESAEQDCGLLSPPPDIVARVELPTAGFVGDAAPVGVVATRHGAPLRESLRVALEMTGPAVFADRAAEGTLLSGGGTSTALLELDRGAARIDALPRSLGELEFTIRDPVSGRVHFQGEVEEDFEPSDGGFVHGGTRDFWVWGRLQSGPQPLPSGTNGWCMRLGDNISDRSYAFLETPLYEIPAEGQFWLEFHHALRVLEDTGSAWVLVSVDGGSYDPLSLYGYGESFFTRYSPERLSLNAFAGRSVSFQFLFQVLSPPGSSWYLDNFKITGLRSRLPVLLSDFDEDFDGSTNHEESFRGTDPLAWDSDRDGLADGVETRTGAFTSLVETGSDPLKDDSDGGGMDDWQESVRGLDPNSMSDDYRESELDNDIHDANGNAWSFDLDGSSHSGSPLRTSFHLTINGRALPQLLRPLLQSPDGQGLVVGPYFLEGLNVTRDILVAKTAPAYCRYLEILQNPSDEAVRATIAIRGKVYDDTTRIAGTSSGDLRLGPEDGWFVVTSLRAEHPKVSFAIGGAGGRTAPTGIQIQVDGSFLWTYDIEVPARKTVALMHLAAFYSMVENALAGAAALGLDGAGATAELQALFLNFPTSSSIGPLFHRGDVNGDGALDISDCLCALLFLFNGGPSPGCLEAADSNNDGLIDCADAVYVAGYLFLGTAAPPHPGPVTADCGADPDSHGSAGDLGCEAYRACP